MQAVRNEKLLYFSGFFGNGFFERGIWILYLLHLKCTLFEVGILQAILNATMFLAEVPTGVIADRFGRKNSLLLGHGFIIVYLSIFLFTDQFYMLALGHVIYGIGLTFISGADVALLYDSMKKAGRENHYSRVIGLYNAIMILALAISMGLGGFFQGYAWSLVFLAGIISQVLAMLFIWQMKEITFDEETEEEQPQSLRQFISEMKEFLLLHSRFKALAIGIALFQGVTSVYYMFNQQVFDAIGYSVMVISIIYAADSLLSAGFSAISYRLEAALTPRKALWMGLVAMGFLYGLVMTDHTMLILISFLGISSLSQLLEPMTSNLVNKEIPSKKRASLLSLINLTTSLVMFILFPLLGYASDRVGSSMLLGIVGIFSIVVTIFCVLVFFREKAADLNENSVS